MRHKIFVPVCVLLFLLVVSFGKPAFADTPGEGSHSMHDGMKMHEGMDKGDHEGYTHQGHQGHGKWGSHRGMGGHGLDPYKKALMCKTKLNLTAEQVNELTNQQMEFKKQRIRNRADMEIAHLDFKKLLSAETLDEAKLQSSAKEMSDMISRQISATFNAQIAVMKILTPEQRKKMAESHSDR